MLRVIGGVRCESGAALGCEVIEGLPALRRSVTGASQLCVARLSCLRTFSVVRRSGRAGVDAGPVMGVWDLLYHVMLWLWGGSYMPMCAYRHVLLVPMVGMIIETWRARLALL